MSRREKVHDRRRIDDLQERSDEFTKQLIKEKQRILKANAGFEKNTDFCFKQRASNKEKAAQLRERHSRLYASLNGAHHHRSSTGAAVKSRNNTRGAVSGRNLKRADGHNPTKLATEHQANLVRILEGRKNKELVKQNQALKSKTETKTRIDKLRFQLHGDTINHLALQERSSEKDEHMEEVLETGDVIRSEMRGFFATEENVKHDNNAKQEEFVEHIMTFETEIQRKTGELGESIAAVANDVIENAKKAEEEAKHQELSGGGAEDMSASNSFANSYHLPGILDDNMSLAENMSIPGFGNGRSTTAHDIVRLNKRCDYFETRIDKDTEGMEKASYGIEDFKVPLSRITHLADMNDITEITSFFNSQESVSSSLVHHVQTLNMEMEQFDSQEEAERQTKLADEQNTQEMNAEKAMFGDRCELTEEDGAALYQEGQEKIETTSNLSNKHRKVCKQLQCNELEIRGSAINTPPSCEDGSISISEEEHVRLMFSVVHKRAASAHETYYRKVHSENYGPLSILRHAGPALPSSRRRRPTDSSSHRVVFGDNFGDGGASASLLTVGGLSFSTDYGNAIGGDASSSSNRGGATHLPSAGSASGAGKSILSRGSDSLPAKSGDDVMVEGAGGDNTTGNISSGSGDDTDARSSPIEVSGGVDENDSTSSYASSSSDEESEEEVTIDRLTRRVTMIVKQPPTADRSLQSPSGAGTRGTLNGSALKRSGTLSRNASIRSAATGNSTADSSYHSSSRK
jgi:hypothetical protein